MSSDFDGGWKDVLDFFTQACLSFLAPDICADIDWTADPQSLEQEFRPLGPESEAGEIRCDKLLRFTLRNEQEVRYLHIEAQCQQHAEFPRRVCDYNQRVTQHYRATVASLVILGDDNPRWIPHSFYREAWGCRSGIDFRPLKLLSYADREEWLEGHPNVMGLIILAHLKALETRDNPRERQAWRLRLWRGAYQRELDQDDRQRLLAIIERFVDLPEEVETALRREFLQEREGTIMPYVTSFERIARQEGRQEGRAEGREEGREEGLRLGIRTVAELRFGNVDDEFLTLLNTAELSILEQALHASKTVSSLGELRAILVSHGNS